jgi:ferritin-like metal-binding protein YciE
VDAFPGLQGLFIDLLKFTIMAKTASKKTTRKTNRKATNGHPGSASKSPSFLQKFFVDQLKDMYYAEKELLTALAKMKEVTTTEELEDAFDDHIKATERHVKRLEKVFQLIGKKPQGKRCEAMDGLIEEGNSIIEETEEGTMTRDAALIIAAQKVEHYEIATYGGLVALAHTMSLTRAAEILDKTLQEEEQTDKLLTEIAEAYINVEAEQEGDYEWPKETEEESAKATAAAF